MMKYKLLCLVFLLLILIRPVGAIYEQRTKFFSSGYTKQYEQLKQSYYSSQYVKKKDPGIIPDETFEMFAAGAFIRGTNPIMIVHDHPPLARYIIGVFILLFDNAHVVIIPALFFSGLGIFLIAHKILKKTFLALIPLGVFINEPLFMNKLSFTPLPEPIQLVFIIFALYFFMRAVKSKKYIGWFLLTNLMIGIVISTRFFVLGVAEFLSMGGYLLLKERLSKKLFFFVLTTPIALCVLLISYLKTMLDGYTPLQIIGVQKYILAYHQSKFTHAFSFWDLLLFNRWHSWWGSNAILSDPQWILVWPFSLIVSLISVITAILSKFKLYEEEKIILLWVFFYSLVLSTGYTSTRYFMPILPFLYIIATSFFVKLIASRKQK